MIATRHGLGRMLVAVTLAFGKDVLPTQQLRGLISIGRYRVKMIKSLFLFSVIVCVCAHTLFVGFLYLCVCVLGALCISCALCVCVCCVCVCYVCAGILHQLSFSFGSAKYMSWSVNCNADVISVSLSAS